MGACSSAPCVDEAADNELYVECKDNEFLKAFKRDDFEALCRVAKAVTATTINTVDEGGWTPLHKVLAGFGPLRGNALIASFVW